METLIGVIIGAALTYFTSIRLSQRDHERARALERITALEAQKALLTILDDEIRLLWNMFHTEVGLVLKESPNNPLFQRSLAYNQDYLTIFKANCGSLGIIENEILRRAIVSFYVSAKMFIEDLHINSTLLDEYQESILRPQRRSRDQIHNSLLAKKVSIKAVYSILETAFSSIDNNLPAQLAAITAEVKTIELNNRKSWLGEMCSDD